MRAKLQTELQRYDDLYPSRLYVTPSIQTRFDPVVYGTRNQSAISHTQLEFYAKNGYLLIESFYSDEEVRVLQNELDRLSRNKKILQYEQAITEKETGKSNILRSLFQVHENNLLFGEMACDQRLVNIAEHILGSEVYIHQSRLNFKPGLQGKPFFWHSDFETWHVEDGMPRMRALSMSISLTDNNMFNGPLMVIPLSHKAFVACVGETPDNHYMQSLQQQDYGVPDGMSIRYLERRGGIKAPTGNAGSLLIFDCNLMHGSNSNISPYPRSNVFFVYNSIENKLTTPFCDKPPRPEFLAARDNVLPIKPIKPDFARR